MTAHRDPPAPGQESVWDFPRPPRLERTERHLRVELGGRAVAETRRGWRVLETYHPPVYYFPPEDVAADCVRPGGGGTLCEWKGLARYWNVVAGDASRPGAAWSYSTPSPGFEPIRDFLAFYPAAMDRCTVDGEPVRPQPGGFYGGWITADLAGPFKGAPGTEGW